MTRSAPEAKQNARSVIEHIWGGAGLSADPLNHLTLSGSQPELATSFHVATGRRAQLPAQHWLARI